jgi:hypothetical protein
LCPGEVDGVHEELVMDSCTSTGRFHDDVVEVPAAGAVVAVTVVRLVVVHDEFDPDLGQTA